MYTADQPVRLVGRDTPETVLSLLSPETANSVPGLSQRSGRNLSPGVMILRGLYNPMKP